MPEHDRHYCITGGIGAGKSYVCRIFKKHGIRIYDTDSEAQRLINTSQDIHDRLVELIGHETYANGKYNTAVVTRFLLASEENKQAINRIVHPAVMDDFYASGMQWMECAILYEAHLERYADKVIAVTAPEEVRMQRIMQRDGITQEKALNWIKGQTDQDYVAKKADYVIVNDGHTDLEKQVTDILKELGELAG